MYLINSTINVEDAEGNIVGEVHQRWHLWKRKYDLYLNRRQFAAIEGNFLAWEFVLKDEAGGELTVPHSSLICSFMCVFLMRHVE